MAGLPAPSQLPPRMVTPPQGDALGQLRDIHVPEAISAVPDAPGWWLLGALIVGLGGYALFTLARQWLANQYRREALVALDNIGVSYLRHKDQALYLTDYNDLLKRVALTHYAREQVANLSGERWVLFLDKSGRTHEFSMGCGQVLMDIQYKPVQKVSHHSANKPAPGTYLIDQAALHRIAALWIKQHQATGGQP